MVNIIVAMDDNFLIGCHGNLPWNIPEDLKLFKSLTENNIVVMGRKTFESIGKALPNRINLVISNTLKKKSDVIIFESLEKAIAFGNNFNKEIFIIGGADIYKEAITKNLAQKICISHIKKKYSGDTFFPRINLNKLKQIKEIKFSEFTYREYLV
ncbi:dihydrofolate reductase [Fusobacterium sp. MFO224]|uniref:dihydrofolate reductase n=1 Tax=Fusobacterium sp. MFO224 TaxID=3378070 RepID=UPI003854E49F